MPELLEQILEHWGFILIVLGVVLILGGVGLGLYALKSTGSGEDLLIGGFMGVLGVVLLAWGGKMND